MAVLRRFRVLLLGVTLLVVAFVLLFGRARPPPTRPAVVPPAGEPAKRPLPASSAHPVDESWTFDVERDGLNYGLSEEQCESAFPQLYQELDRARDFLLSENRLVKEADVRVDAKGDYTGLPHGEFHVMISNGELYVLEEKKGEPDRSRGLAALASMHRAITALPDPRSLPNIEFVLDIEDRAARGEKNPQRIRWAWAREETDPWLWVMPDFNGWSYPDDGIGSYVQFREEVAELEAQYANGWDDKEEKLTWRGSLAVNRKLRMALVDASAGHDWNNVKMIDWHDRSNVMPMREFCRSKYVAHTEGNSWSGRLRYLHNCNSVPIIHKLNYVFHYQPLLKDSGPRQNYVKVNRDWSDLKAQMDGLIADPERARRIALESTRVFRDRYLTPAAEACYWRRMFRNWRAVMDFEPRRYETKSDGTKVRRGVSWERFAFRQKKTFEHGFWESDGGDQ
ncbi:glycosyl transferase family 90-domain-containing protein [Durotheca rogersii]|uniref:glycosyl transferase family 90-domain-containing protein n=1 Tax=Durotheca rogersii TaxID=419775 RepID=UPI00221FCD9D|nr:glycosyl transferase family 90-domain-containing protein [Durotheca rogersii]KAI5856776.1 glycosyl transferase family 90-domain-containing protein [Durotheca rogersii]